MPCQWEREESERLPFLISTYGSFWNPPCYACVLWILRQRPTSVVADKNHLHFYESDTHSINWVNASVHLLPIWPLASQKLRFSFCSKRAGWLRICTQSIMISTFWSQSPKNDLAAYCLAWLHWANLGFNKAQVSCKWSPVLGIFV